MFDFVVAVVAVVGNSAVLNTSTKASTATSDPSRCTISGLISIETISLCVSQAALIDTSASAKAPTLTALSPLNFCNIDLYFSASIISSARF